MAFNPWKAEVLNERRKLILDAILKPRQIWGPLAFIIVVFIGGFLLFPHTLFQGGWDWFFLILYAVILTGGGIFIGKRIDLYDDKEDA